MEKENKITLVRSIISALLLGITFVPQVTGLANTIICLVAYFIIGIDVLYHAITNIFHGKVFDEHFLMALATVGAVAIGEHREAVAVMLFYQIGELFQDIAVDKSRDSISSLMDIRPDYANIEENGDLKQVPPDSVDAGSIIVVKPGEKIPLDGVVVSGTSSLNTTALTGESLPRDVKEGDTVISGCINILGLLKIRTTGTYGESTVAKILELVENSEQGKAKTERFITRFAKIYTPAVVIGAVLLAFVPPLLFSGSLSEWLHRALIFLVISCPCALVVSVPLGFFGGIGGASKCGVLIKGSNHLETLAKVKTVVFDKTGTLTKGSFSVSAVHPESISKEELLEIAALAESYSDHPISVSLRNAYKKAIDNSRISDVESLAGHGIKALVDGKTVYAGNSRLMDEIGVKWKPCHHHGTIIHISVDGDYAGHIVISDEIKPQSKDAISALRAEGVDKTVMLTGDRKEVGENVAKELAIDEVYSELLPADKVTMVESLLCKAPSRRLAFVGDGINDAPVLKRADVGIAMGALGSDAAIEAADIVLMDDDPMKIAKAIKISRRTLRIVTENIVFALAIKFAILLLGAFGVAGMWLAVFADVGVAFIAILNSLRAMQS